MGRAAIPSTPPPVPELPKRKYRVLSRRYVYGKKGEVIELALTDSQELSLIQAGTLERADERPLKSADKEG